MWQEFIVASCVLIALIAVVRRLLPGGTRCGSGCNGCASQGQCKTETPADAEPVKIYNH